MDICIDLETGDTTPSSAIFSVAALIFNPYALETPTATLHFAVDPQENDKEPTKRSFSGATMSWWTQQPEALQALSTLPQRSLRQVAQELNAMISIHNPRNIWAMSPSFDVAILRHLYAQLDTPFPIPFHRERDVRTVKAALPFHLHPEFQGCKHSALDDARHQATLVQTFFAHTLTTKRITPCTASIPNPVNTLPPSS